jgi:hypothetical protein
MGMVSGIWYVVPSHLVPSQILSRSCRIGRLSRASQQRLRTHTLTWCGRCRMVGLCVAA